MSKKEKMYATDNYSKIKKIRNANECLFNGIDISCSNKGKHKTEKNHLIQKSSYLERIAYDNKVLVFDFESRDYKKNNGNLVERNIDKATTFHVLCGDHDKYLFDEIENGKKFDKNNKKQLFQFALRAFVFYISEQMLKGKFDNIVSKNANKVADVHLKIDKERLELFKVAVCKKEWDSVETKIIILKQKIEFISCYAGTPNYGRIFPIVLTNCMITINIFPQEDDNDTIILLSYLKNDRFANQSSKFCNRLEKLAIKNEKCFVRYMNKFITAFDHNIAINPKYWKGLSDKDKEKFYEIAHIFPKCKNISDGLKGYFELKFKKDILRLISQLG